MPLNGVQLFAEMPLYNIPNTWTYWLELVLIMMLMYINVIQPHYIVNSIRAMVAPMGRRYEDCSDIRMPVLQGLFSVGTLALTSVTLINTMNPQMPSLNGMQWGVITAVILAIVLIKCGIDRWLNYIFQFSTHMRDYRLYRNTIWQLIGIILLSYLIVSPMLSSMTLKVTPLVIGIVYISILSWKIISTLGISVNHILYLIIYLIHAEVLPLVAIGVGTHYLIQVTN